MSENEELQLSQQIDHYLEDLFVPKDPILEQALQEMKRNGLPGINVSANEGQLLYMLAKLVGASKVLEIGTLGAYSTIWLARALPPQGRVITLEYEPKHAEVARRNLERAGLSDKVEVRLGAGLDLLPEIEKNGEGPFDLFFIDADKGNYPGYLDWAIKLAHPGSLILSDNLLRNGEVLKEDSGGANQVIREYNRKLATDPRLESLIIPQRPGEPGILSEEPILNLTSGYIQRALSTFPRQGSKAPWKLYQNYLKDVVLLKWKPVNDGTLGFRKVAVSKELAHI